MHPRLTVLRVREANEGWACYIQRVVDREYGGNQSSLALAIGVSPSTITRWIDGATPTIGALHDVMCPEGGVLGLWAPLRHCQAQAR